MKPVLFLAFVCIVMCSVNSSCKKSTETIIQKDTVMVRSVDTTFKMSANSWNYFDYQTLNFLDSGATTYFTTSDGVQFRAQAYRMGARLQSKSEVGFFDKTIYFKWKGFGDGELAVFVPQIKYDALSKDNTPANQGVDLGLFAMNGPLTGAVAVMENTWYYTRVVPISGTDNYRVITSTGNFNNAGGIIISDVTMPIYTKSGYPGMRMGDPYGGTNSYGVFSEFRIVKD